MHVKDSNSPPVQQEKTIAASPRRSLLILALMTLVALGLIFVPRPAQYYPNVILHVAGTMDLEFVFLPQNDESACLRLAQTVNNAAVASCRECQTRSIRCLKNPTPDVLDLFGESPLAMPSVRSVNGVMLFKSSSLEYAQMACTESERQLLQGNTGIKATCYPAESRRSYSNGLQSQQRSEGNTLTLLMSLAGGLLASIVIIITITHFRVKERQTPQHLTLTHPWVEKIALAGIDTFVLLGTFLLFAWPTTSEIQQWTTLERNSVIAHGTIIAVTIGWFWITLEHYAQRRPFWDELRETIKVLLLMTMFSGATAFALGQDISRLNYMIVWALNLLLLPVARNFIRLTLDDLGLWQRPAIIVGTGENAREAFLAITGELNMGYNVIGFVDLDSINGKEKKISINEVSFNVYEKTIINNLPVTTQIFIAIETLDNEDTQIFIKKLISTRLDIHIIPALRGLPLLGTKTSHFFSHEVLLLTVRNNLSRRSLQFGKRIFDITAASILLVFLTPLLIYIAWRIWREDGRPVIFHQNRVARNSGEFKFIKFRSMINEADDMLSMWREKNTPEWQEYYSNNFKLKNDPRVLRIGKWIRATSIDELPQLINVLRGDMSLVGPRPLLSRELPEYGDSINLYRQARPGITGLWQISGRSQTKFSDRASLDEWYVQNWSLWYDIAILFKTIKVVINKNGAH